MHLEFSDKKGPILGEPVRNKSAVEKLIIPDTEDSMPFVLDTIKILRRELENTVPFNRVFRSSIYFGHIYD